MTQRPLHHMNYPSTAWTNGFFIRNTSTFSTAHASYKHCRASPPSDQGMPSNLQSGCLQIGRCICRLCPICKRAVILCKLCSWNFTHQFFFSICKCNMGPGHREKFDIVFKCVSRLDKTSTDWTSICGQSCLQSGCITWLGRTPPLSHNRHCTCTNVLLLLLAAHYNIWRTRSLLSSIAEDVYSSKMFGNL